MEIILKFFNAKNLLNFLFFFSLFYLIYHSVYGKYNIQNYLIHQFEERMYQDFHYNLKKEIDDINMDILVLLAEDDDMLDEINKKLNPSPREGEIVIKID